MTNPKSDVIRILVRGRAVVKPSGAWVVYFEIHRGAIGCGLWETVRIAKPTKEDKVRRKAKKPSASQIRKGANAYADKAHLRSMLTESMSDTGIRQMRTSVKPLCGSREKLPRINWER
jgi:hypothetical protein